MSRHCNPFLRGSPSLIQWNFVSILKLGRLEMLSTCPPIVLLATRHYGVMLACYPSLYCQMTTRLVIRVSILGLVGFGGLIDVSELHLKVQCGLVVAR